MKLHAESAVGFVVSSSADGFPVLAEFYRVPWVLAASDGETGGALLMGGN